MEEQIMQLENGAIAILFQEENLTLIDLLTKNGN